MPMPDPEMFDEDLPELGDDFFARARPAAEVMEANPTVPPPASDRSP